MSTGRWSTCPGSEPQFGPPKTKASHRTVPLAAVTLEVLAAHLAQYPSGEDGLVFTTSRGEPWRRTAFGEAIRSARTAAGLPDGVSFHDLRHHFASVLIAAGCSIKAVQSALGHANASETLDAYSHLWPADEDRIRDAIENVHGAALSPLCHEPTPQVADQGEYPCAVVTRDHVRPTRPGSGRFPDNVVSSCNGGDP